MVSVEQSLSNFAVSCICYTDSLIVLHWIRCTDKHWKPFVQNRVREIRGKVESSHWHHCQGEANPADMPSRGLTLKELKDSQVWFYGPSWLKEKSLFSMQIQDDLPPECLEELRVKDKEALVLSVIESKGSIGAITDIERFSSLEKLLNTTAYILLFLEILKGRVRTSSTSGSLEKTDRDSVVGRAETLWIEEVQRGRITEAWKTQFTLFQDGVGVWRCGGDWANRTCLIILDIQYCCRRIITFLYSWLGGRINAWHTRE